MKKYIFPFCFLFSFMYGSDTLFELTKSQKIDLINNSSVPISFELLSDFMIPTDTNTIESSNGFNFEVDGESFSKLSVRNYSPSNSLQVLQVKHIDLSPNGSLSVNVPSPHYIKGIKSPVDFDWNVLGDKIDLIFRHKLTAPTLNQAEEKNCDLIKDDSNLELADYSNSTCSAVDTINRTTYYLAKKQVIAKRVYHYEKAKTLLSAKSNVLNSIPHILHRVWLTGKDNPSDIDHNLLEKVKLSSRSLGRDWAQIFWFNADLPNTKSWILENIPNAEIRDLDPIILKMRGKKIFDQLFDLQDFKHASILLRYNILSMFGGFYINLGSSLTKNMQHMATYFDYILVENNNDPQEKWFDVNIIASKKQSNLWQKLFQFFDYMNKQKYIPSFYKNPGNIPTEQDLLWISGIALSAMVDNALTETDAFLPLRNS